MATRRERSSLTDTTLFDALIYEPVIVNHLDPYYMGTLEVELIKRKSSNDAPERSGQILMVKYLSPFYGVTPLRGVQETDGYRHSQQSYGFWAVPPDVGTKVLVLFVGGQINHGYWIGCIQDFGMNFMVPDGRASTENTTDGTPDNIKGIKLPVGEYNKKLLEDTDAQDPTFYQKPYNNDFTQILEVQGLLYDETRGTTTTSARREAPSMVFGISTPGPQDKRYFHPKVTYGGRKKTVANLDEDSRPEVPFSRLGGSSFVMDDGDDKFIRLTHASDGPPYYVNKEGGEEGGDETIPQNELIRIRTRTGHQILLHNSEDVIYISNSRGTAWIEMTSDGKIDIHAQDSVSIMTEQDFNLTAERDINIEAGRNINLHSAGRWADKRRVYDDIPSGNINFQSVNDVSVVSGENSSSFKFDKDTFNINVDDDIKITTTKNIHMHAGGNIYTQADGSMHQTVAHNWFRKTGFTVTEDCTDLYNQIGNSINSTIGNSHFESVAVDHNLTVGGNKKVSVSGISSYETKGDHMIKTESVFYTEASGNIHLLTSADLFAESSATLNLLSGTNLLVESASDLSLTSGASLFNNVAGSFNVQSGGISAIDGSQVRLNSGSSSGGPGAVPADAAPTVAATDAIVGLSGNSPLAPEDSTRAPKSPLITLPRVIPGTSIPTFYETIVPRAPQHEPWPHHENLDPLEFKAEKTDRERIGELKPAERILTPDTFRKNVNSRQRSELVRGSVGSRHYTNSGAGINYGANSSATGLTGEVGGVTPTGPTIGTGMGRVNYVQGFSNRIRNKPIQERLMKILAAASEAAGVDAIIFSGGQDARGTRNARRTGSTRHDNGFGADVWLYSNGKRLSTMNSSDLNIIITFIKECRKAGALGVGAGTNGRYGAYMNNIGIHIDISRAGVWGGAAASQDGAPSWLIQAYRG
jgi:uncharacterized protein (DUF2345 family)